MNIASFLQLAKRSLIRLLHYLVHRVQKDKSFVSGCKNILKNENILLDFKQQPLSTKFVLLYSSNVCGEQRHYPILGKQVAYSK